ncbi:MAG: hypothetical protein ACHP7K_00405 [Actinomycetales bacterium]|jgi:hypothetical protein
MTQPPNGTPVYPPAAYAPAVPQDLTTAPPASLLRWFSSPAAAGVLVAVLWWLLAPGGAFYGAGTNTADWLPRDLVLGLLGAAAGIATACFLLPQRRLRSAWTKILAAVLGCCAGSVIAWQLGTFAGSIWGPAAASGTSDSVAFSLRSYAVLAVWPGVCALILFLTTLASMLGSGADND